LTLWSVRDGERLLRSGGGPEAVESVVVAPDGAEFMGAGFCKKSENGLIAWRFGLTDGRRLPAFSNPARAHCTFGCLALTPSGRKVVAGVHSILPVTRRMDVGSSLAATLGAGLLGAAVGADTSFLIGVYSDKGQAETFGLQAYTVEGGVLSQKLSGVDQAIVKVAVSPDGLRAVGALAGGDLAFFALQP
jgi:hypothetical protein